MPTYPFNFTAIDCSWHDCIQDALKKMDSPYLEHLQHTHHWLPGPEKIFNAFSLPLSQTHYILLGESPYPRAHSANGYAFWDAAVTNLWTTDGLSKAVNRATSLRNLIKMLLVAEGLLPPEQTGQPHIAAINKQPLAQTNAELFTHLLKKGFLLLNASLVLQSTPVQKDIQAWQNFISHVIHFIYQRRPTVYLIIFGRPAKKIQPLIKDIPIHALYAEHPYNHSFINNPDVIQFFRPLHLLTRASPVAK